MASVQKKKKKDSENFIFSGPMTNVIYLNAMLNGNQAQPLMTKGFLMSKSVQIPRTKLLSHT